MKAAEISDRARVLAAIPATEIRPICDTVCVFLLIDRTEVRRIWRCECCLRFVEAPVYRTNEITHRRTPTRTALLPDQSTIYDLFADTPPLSRSDHD